MSIQEPLFAYFGFLMKDFGTRMVMCAHWLTKIRQPYHVLRHQNIRVYRGLMPITEDAAYVAPSASIIGNVVLGHNSSVFYHSTLRNFHTREPVRIGDNTTILDRVSFMGQVKVGNNTVIGIGTTLDSCDVHDNVIVGTGCTICLGAVIENGAIVASGSVIESDVRVPAGELWAGNPAQKIQDVTEEQRTQAENMQHQSVELAKLHRRNMDVHLRDSGNYDFKWLKRMCDQIEAHQSVVAFPVDVKLPMEAKQFLKPRLNAQLPHMHARVSYPVNRIAPHMVRNADQTGNC